MMESTMGVETESMSARKMGQDLVQMMVQMMVEWSEQLLDATMVCMKDD